jgi:hypothetical protein
MVIQFNASMLEWQNLTLMNSSVLDIYIVPAYDRHHEPSFKMSTLNMTWNATYFFGDTL